LLADLPILPKTAAAEAAKNNDYDNKPYNPPAAATPKSTFGIYIAHAYHLQR
jgi:hypothetical protein